MEAYDSYADALYRHCLFRISDPRASEEVVQEAFMKTWEYLSKGNQIDEFRPFLYRVVHNLIVDHLRRRRPVLSLDDLSQAGFDIGTGSKGDEESKIDAKSLITLLDELDTKYREVLVMRYIDDLTIGEIAAVSGEKENAVSVRLHRAIKKLKELHDERNQ